MTDPPHQMQMVVQSDGTICSIYCEMLNLACLGQVEVRRASHVSHFTPTSSLFELFLSLSF